MNENAYAPSTALVDTLRENVEQMMSLTAKGVLCKQLRDALDAYLDREAFGPMAEIGTGGGGTAWEATLVASATQSVVLMVTDENLSHPECDDDPVSMGLYLRDDEDENVLNRWVVFDSVAEALAAVQRGFTGAVWTEGNA